VLKRVDDGEEGVDYLNGQSRKYRGDGWNAMTRARRKLDAALKGYAR
jgi:mannose/cellobiose epimerase-like protein (N-acyl-D-glucosamine 2-epimerase family)